MKFDTSFKYYILTKNNRHRAQAIQQILFDYGYNWEIRPNEIQYLDADAFFPNYREDNHITHAELPWVNNQDYVREMPTLDDLLDWCEFDKTEQEKRIYIENNVVNFDPDGKHIKVGCKKIEWDIVEKIYNKMKALREF